MNRVDSSNTKSANAIATINRKRRELLSNGYSFNSFEATLNARSSDSKVPVPRTYLFIQWPKNLTRRIDPSDKVTLLVWDMSTNDWYSETLTKLPVTVDITDYSLLPERFANWLAHEAAITYYREVNEGASPPEWLIRDWNRAFTRFNDEERRSAPANILDATGWNEYQSDAYVNGIRVIGVGNG